MNGWPASLHVLFDPHTQDTKLMKYITFRNIVAYIVSMVLSTIAMLGLLRVHDYEQEQHEQYVHAVAHAADRSGSKFDKQ